MFTASTKCGDPEQREDDRMPAGLLFESLPASMSASPRSAVEAPVTMLRVYCTWPGVSAMMNFRLGVAK